MPYAAPRLCNRHGLHTGRCQPCEQTRQAQADTKTKAERGFYGSQRWKNARTLHRQREPLCRECKSQGRIKAGAVVDHIVPIRQGADPWDATNYQTLCWSCHQRKRQQERAA